MLRSRRLARQSLDFAALSPGSQIERPFACNVTAIRRKANRNREWTRRENREWTRIGGRMRATTKQKTSTADGHRFTQMEGANLRQCEIQIHAHCAGQMHPIKIAKSLLSQRPDRIDSRRAERR